MNTKTLTVFKSESKTPFVYPAVKHQAKVIYADPAKSLQIRTMSLPELVTVRQNWLIPEGWPGIMKTMHASYACDPQGFYLLEEDQQPIASISVVTMPEIKAAYIGFYLVEKSHRGRGYGKLLLAKTMEYTAEQRGITSFGLNCVENAQPIYEHFGFKLAGIDDFWKYTATSDTRVQPAAIKQVSLNTLDDHLLADIARYDFAVLGTDRSNFLRNFLFKPSTITIISQQDGIVNGYGILSAREAPTAEPNPSFKIAPLYADNDMIAGNILQAMLSNLKPDESIYLESPWNNATAASVLHELGFTKYFAQAKMYAGEVPKFDSARMFCYSSIALGG